MQHRTIFGRCPIRAKGQWIALAIALGCLAGVLELLYLTHIAPYVGAFDFTWAYEGGKALVAGRNPYVAIQPTGEFPHNSGFKYPLPVALVGVPFSVFSPRVATAVFGAVGIALLVYAMARDGWWRLPLLVSAPCLLNVELGQWSLLLAVAALMPSLSWLSCVKPTTGLAAFVYKPSRWAIIGGGAIYVACLALNSRWPLEWVSVIRADPASHWYIPAIALTGGPLLLLAAFKWRTPEGRMLLLYALIPQVQAFYSTFLLMLVARTYRECLLLAVLSLAGYFGWLSFDWFTPGMAIQDPSPHQAPWVMLFVYLPVLVLVLRRQNIAAE